MTKLSQFQYFMFTFVFHVRQYARSCLLEIVEHFNISLFNAIITVVHIIEMLILIFFSLLFFRVILQALTSCVQKGCQTLCNLNRSNDFHQVIRNSTESSNSLIKRVLEKGRKNCLCFASQPKKRINQGKVSLNTIACGPLVQQLNHNEQTYQRRLTSDQKKTCTTNQLHVKICTINATTEPSTPNRNKQAKKKIENSCDNSNYCINKNNNNNNNQNNINTIRQSEWYIELASNCYRNGFELHVNYLDECAKHPTHIYQRESAQSTFLRLPSLAWLSCLRPNQPKCDRAVSLVTDTVVCCSSPKSIKFTT